MVKFKTIRGVRDILYPESSVWDRIERKAEDTFRSYGYRKAYLPVVEYTDLFSRTIGEVTDIVAKEMYAFKDRKGRDIALRPEGTAGAVRAVIQSGLMRGSFRVKVFYAGPMFRYERPQEGRYRQFYQIGCEVFGSDDPEQDAEIAELALKILAGCPVPGVLTLRINSMGCPICREKYRRVIRNYLAPRIDEVCGDCRRRLDTNTLRILDCKKKRCREVLWGAGSSDMPGLPSLHENLCSSCRDRFSEYSEKLGMRIEMAGLKEKTDIVHDDKLVRGLDYYTGVVFEIEAGGFTVAAGGRYDLLVKQLGGPDIPACGWALGLERLALCCETVAEKIPRIYVALTEGGDRMAAVRTVSSLRDYGLTVTGDYEKLDISKKFKLADRTGAEYTILFGENEKSSGTATVKNMVSSEQEQLGVDTVIERMKGLYDAETNG